MFAPAAHRLARALTGVVAVWCLGCTSFNTLIEIFLDEPAAGSASCVMADDAATAAPESPAFASVDERAAVDACGCSHCIAIQVIASAIAPIRHPLPDAIVRELKPAHSVDRQPLVRPPVSSVAA
jgi:hypothetical protein